MLARYLSFLYERPGAALLWSPLLYRLYANSSGQRLLAQDDEARVHRIAAAVAASGDAVVERVGGVELSFGPLFDERSRVDGVIAVHAPPTALPRLLNALQEPARSFARLVHVLPAIVMTARPSGAIDLLNTRWYEVTGQQRRDAVAWHSFSTAIIPAARAAALDAWSAGVKKGVPFAFELRLATTAGPRWYELRAEPSRTGGRIIKWIAAMHDIEDEVRARLLLGRSERQLRVIADVSRALASVTDVQTIAAAAVAVGSDDVTWAVALGERGGQVTMARPAADLVLLPQLAGLGQSDAGALCRTLADGRTALAVAIRGDRGAFVAVVARDDAETVRAEWLSVLNEVALRVDLALERALAFERERLIAETLQRAMLPTAMPRVEGIGFDVAYAPAARERHVGGDWYDAFDLGERRIAIAMGDVTGHGLDAAIVMSQLRQIMRAASFEDCSPEHVLAAANRVLFAGGDALASAFYGVLDSVTMRLTYASAGHPPPVAVGRDGEVRFLDVHSVLLGVTAGGSVGIGEAELAPDSALVLYTDGVVEAGRDLLAGERTLADVVASWARAGFDANAVELQRRVIGDRIQADDAAMLVVHVAPADRLSLTLPASRENAQRLRRAFARFLAGGADEPAAAFEATLAVGEAINNVVLHAYDERPGPVRLVVRRVGERVVATVWDDGQWPEHTAALPGHGIDIMEKLVPDVQIRRGPRGSHVSFRIPVAVSAGS